MNIELTKNQKAYYYGFIVSCLICLSPFKALAYITPFIFIFVMAVASTELKGILFRWFCLCSAIFGVIAFYFIVYSDFIVKNALLTVVTYSSFIPLVIIPSKELNSVNLVHKISRASVSIFVFEGVFGIIQAVYGATQNGGFGADNGDFVEGTIHLGLIADRSFGNPIFVYNMIFLGLSSLLYVLLFAKKKQYKIVLGYLSIILASVVHLIVFFFASICGTMLLCYLSLRNKKGETFRKIVGFLKKGVVVLVIFSAVVILAIGDNIAQIPFFLTKITSGDIAKAEITLYALFDIPQEEHLFPYIGLGPGQFSSRASLIASGFYLSNNENNFLGKEKPRVLTDKYMYSLLLRELDAEYVGSTTWPWYSLLSIYTEFGVIGLFIVLYIFFRMIKKLLQKISLSYEKAIIGMVALIELFFIFFSAFQENYWELTHAIFLGILSLRIYYHYVTKDSIPPAAIST